MDKQWPMGLVRCTYLPTSTGVDARSKGGYHRGLSTWSLFHDTEVRWSISYRFMMEADGRPRHWS